MSLSRCPLCQYPASQPYHQDERRAYRQCPRCQLVFVPSAHHLSAAAEKAIYDSHDNRPDDPGYRRFLSRLAEPLQARLAPGMHGLDFGCGPGPTLSMMMVEAGYPCAVYDPFYAPNAAVLGVKYDFITCSEAIEHFHHPGNEWARWLDMLKPGGWLGIMTKRVASPQAFAGWHYKQDPTHVCFFSEATFTFLAARDGLTLTIAGPDVVLMQRRR